MKINIYRIFFLLGVVFSLNIIFIACTKENDNHDPITPACPTAKYPVSGVWEGTAQTDQVQHAPSYQGFSVFPDGTFLRRFKVVGVNEIALCKGIWKLSGKVFEFRDTTIAYSGGFIITQANFKFHDSLGTLSDGKWQVLQGHHYTGIYQTMKRIN